MVPIPQQGRVYSAQRRVRVGDASPSGRLRLDAVAHYLQDLSGDDTEEADLDDDLAWVVRRAAIEVHAPGRFRELLTMSTFCSGIGRRWAERRMALEGDQGAWLDVAVLWVRVDASTGAPVSVGEQFLERFGAAAGGRQVTSRLSHSTTLPDQPDGRRPWQARFCDYDLFGHVNNAVAWEMLEEVRVRTTAPDAPYRGEVAYRAPIERTMAIDLVWSEADRVVWVWGVDSETGAVAVSGRLEPLPA